MNYRKMNPVFAPVSKEVHPEYEIKSTRPSDYLRKYGTGRVDELPQTSKPELTDDRTVDQMLDEPCAHMSTETVDVLMEIEAHKDEFTHAVEEYKLTQKQKEQFDAAVKVLNDANATTDAKREAYAFLEELREQGKLTRARD